MYGLRVPALIAGGSLGALVLAIVVGNAIIGAGLVRNPNAFQTPAKIVFFTLFVLFGFSLIPLMVRIVLGAQVAFGNANVAPVRAAIDHSYWIVGCIWALMAAGLVVALPAAIRDGFFSNDSASSSGDAAAEKAAAEAIARMPTQGTLVAAPGMEIRQMRAESTLRIRSGSSSSLFSGARFGGAAIFDYRIAGSRIVFQRCRYYYITTYTHAPDRIEAINVGISPEKLTRPQLNAAESAVRARLKNDGWRLADDRVWTKRGVVLDLRSRRLDDPVTGEDSALAGEWMEYVELRAAR
jgi:hypothetical protein